MKGMKIQAKCMNTAINLALRLRMIRQAFQVRHLMIVTPFSDFRISKF